MDNPGDSEDNLQFCAGALIAMKKSGVIYNNWITRFAASDEVKILAPPYWLDIDALDVTQPVMSLEEFEAQ